MQHLDETDMLMALKNGDLKAYQYFFMKFYKPLCLKARLMLNNMQEAEELVQQIFVQVWEQQQYMEIEHSVGGYLYRLVHNSCVNLLRNGQSDNRPTTDHGLLLMQGAVLPLPGYQGYYGLLPLLLYRQQLMLYYIRKSSYIEVAQLMEICAKNLKTNLIGIWKELRVQIRL